MPPLCGYCGCCDFKMRCFGAAMDLGDPNRLPTAERKKHHKKFEDKRFRVRVRATQHYYLSNKKEGVPEMGTKPLRALSLRGYRASTRGSKGL